MVRDPEFPVIPKCCTSIEETPDPTNSLLYLLSKKNSNLVFKSDTSEVSTLRVSPSIREIGGLIEDPILTNLLPGSYTAVTALVPDDTIFISKTSFGLRV